LSFQEVSWGGRKIKETGKRGERHRKTELSQKLSRLTERKEGGCEYLRRREGALSRVKNVLQS